MTRRNLVLCSDGTGNSGGKTRGTNVWRLYNAIDRHSATVKQLAFYDDGVGTDRNRYTKMAGGAFGWGLTRNLIQLYGFLVRHYQPGDRIFLFGFSRGAFTVRALAGMICACGLWDRQEFLKRPDRDRILKRILRAYRAPPAIGGSHLRSRRAHDLRALNERFGFQEVEIHFIGVWDTVDAVGMPIDEVRNALDPISLVLFGRRAYGFHDSQLSPKVRAAAQALAIDDERKTFHPNVWEPRQDIEQVWFAGAHANVGGGYPKDGMAHVTLDWMLGQATQSGLEFRKHARERVQERADVHAKLYDSRSGLGFYYRHAPRDLRALCGSARCRVHTSVYERADVGTDGYAPPLPANAEPATTDQGPYERSPVPLPRLAGLDWRRVAALVSRRRRVYRWFLGLTLALAALAGWQLLAAGMHADRLSSLRWFSAGGGVLLLVGLRRYGTSLVRRTREEALRAWREAGEESSRRP